MERSSQFPASIFTKHITNITSEQPVLPAIRGFCLQFVNGDLARKSRLGARPLTIEDVLRVARDHAPVQIAGASRARIALGRQRLDELVPSGERIYGVNTGVGGNA